METQGLGRAAATANSESPGPAGRVGKRAYPGPLAPSREPDSGIPAARVLPSAAATRLGDLGHHKVLLDPDAKPRRRHLAGGEGGASMPPLRHTQAQGGEIVRFGREGKFRAPILVPQARSPGPRAREKAAPFTRVMPGRGWRRPRAWSHLDAPSPVAPCQSTACPHLQAHGARSGLVLSREPVDQSAFPPLWSRGLKAGSMGALAALNFGVPGGKRVEADNVSRSGSSVPVAKAPSLLTRNNSSAA